MKTKLTLALVLFFATFMHAQDQTLIPIVDGFNVQNENTFYSSSIPYYIVKGVAKTSAYTSGVKSKYATGTINRSGFLFFDISALTQEIGHANLRLTEKIGQYQTDETKYPFDVVVSYRYYDLNTSNIPTWANQGDREDDYTVIDTLSITAKAADVYNINNQKLTEAINDIYTNGEKDTICIMFRMIGNTGGKTISFENATADATIAPQLTIWETAPVSATLQNLDKSYYDGSAAPENLSVSIEGGAAPYTVTYSDGMNSQKVTSNDNPVLIPISPSTSTTYTITSVTQSGTEISMITNNTVSYTVKPREFFFTQGHIRTTGSETISLAFRANGTLPITIEFSNDSTVVLDTYHSIDDTVKVEVLNADMAVSIESITDANGAFATEDILWGTTNIYISSEDDEIIKASNDTYIESNNPDLDKNAEKTLLIKQTEDESADRESYIEFDISSISGNVGALLELSIYSNNSTDPVFKDIELYGVQENFSDITTFTWTEMKKITLNESIIAISPIQLNAYNKDLGKKLVFDISDYISSLSGTTATFRLAYGNAKNVYTVFRSSNYSDELAPKIYYKAQTATTTTEAKTEISFYPNPANSTLTFTTAENREIYTIAGQKVMSSIEQVVNISNLDNGIYVIVTGNKAERFVKVQ